MFISRTRRAETCQACALLLLLGIIFVSPTGTVAYADRLDANDDSDGRPNITTVFDYIITVDPDNGVNDSSCYPSSPGVQARAHCRDINFALRFPNRTHSTKFILIPGTTRHYLQHNVLFSTAFNVAFIGNGSIQSMVECAPKAGLSFVNSTNVVLENVHFRFCGALHNSTSMDFREKAPQKYQLSLVSLYFYNCSDITMYNVVVNESRNATGVVMYDTVGYNYISKCAFDRNVVDPKTSDYAGGGGFAVEFSFCPPGQLECNTSTYNHFSQYRRNYNAHYVFYKCTFQNNIAVAQALLHYAASEKMDKFVVMHHNETHEIFGRGAGLAIHFKGEAKNNTIDIQDCVFSNNEALWGGAVAIACRDTSMDNTVTIQQSHFIGNRCFRTLEYGAGGGGIMIASSLEMWNLNTKRSLKGNHVSMSDSEFIDNYSLHGGGLLYYLTLQLNIKAVTLDVSRCNFTRNVGRLGSAVKVSPYLVFGSGNTPSIKFSDCIFKSNTIDYINHSSYRVGLGAMYISGIPVTFQSEAKFLHNNGSAIGVVNTDMDCSDAIMSFIGNRGTDGGAMALVGAVTVLIGEKTKMNFEDNHVSRFGGAIYTQYVGREHMQASVMCFVHYTDPFVHQRDWRSTFMFRNNTADKLGNSIYTTSIAPCTWSDDNASNVFCGNEHWNFYTSSGEDASCTEEVFTEAQSFSVADVSTAYPGKGFILNITAMDDLEHDVTSQMVYSAYTSDQSTARVDPKFTYVTAGYVGLMGEGNQSVTLELETANSRVTHLRLQVELKRCPPGLIPTDAADDSSDFNLGMLMDVNQSSITCKCRDEFTYGGDLSCFEDRYSAQIRAGNWIGTIPDGDESTLFMSHFPWEFHHFIKKKGSDFLTLPDDFNELDSSICRPANRTGLLCGKCIDGYATSVNSLEFQCVPCADNSTNIALNIFTYVSLTFVPYVILFGIIIFFNAKLTSSAVNSFVLFAQLVSANIFPIDGNKLSYLNIGRHLSVSWKIYTFVYGVFNLDSFSMLMHPFCINKNFTTLDVICLDYAIAAFPLLVIVVIRLLFSLKSRSDCCAKKRRRSIRQVAPHIEATKSPKRSLVHVFIACIFLSYTKFCLASMKILNSTALYDETNEHFGSPRIYYAGHYTFKDKEYFFPYGFLTLFVLVFFVLLPPILLLGPLSFVDWLLDKQKFSFLQEFWPSIAVHSFMDAAFHGYKLNRRFFAGIYLLFRLSIFLNYSFNNTQTLRLIVQQILCSVMMLLVATFQPHQKQFFNYVDSLILLSLVILNALSTYMSVVQLEASYSSFPVGVYAFGYVLVWLPFLYVVTYFVWTRVLQYTKCGVAIKMNFTTLRLCNDPDEASEYEVTRPLLRPDSGESNAETDDTLSDEEMFRRARDPNRYRPATPDGASNSDKRTPRTTNSATAGSTDSSSARFVSYQRSSGPTRSSESEKTGTQ